MLAEHLDPGANNPLTLADMQRLPTSMEDCETKQSMETSLVDLQDGFHILHLLPYIVGK